MSKASPILQLFRPSSIFRNPSHAYLFARAQVPRLKQASLPNFAGKMSVEASPVTDALPAAGKRKLSRSPSPAAEETFGQSSSEAVKSNGKDAKKRQKGEAKYLNRLRKDAQKQISKFGEDPVYHEARELLGQKKVEEILSTGREFEKKYERGEEVEVQIKMLGAHGQGLAVAPGHDWLIAVPKALPGDRVKVQIRSNERLFSKARVVEFLHKSQELRDQEPFCQYFDSCGGCQYQMMSYERQLKIKQKVVENAFKHYFTLDPALLPEVRPTMPSPKQRAYRTKLTPHFDLPREVKAYRKSIGIGKGKGKAVQNVEEEGGPLPVKPEVEVAIGFDSLEGHILDIEECPLGTEAINAALPQERKRIKDTIFDFPFGATVLLRDSLKRFDAPADECIAVTDHKATVKEIVGSTKFESPAGAFFQNNRSILPDLLGYVREEILSARRSDRPNGSAGRFLVDAYCGSGLFSLCLADLFERVAGVEISPESINCAKSNATLNGIENAVFLAGSAENIFATIDFAPEHTTMIIDPPRRGCDEAFIEQLVKLGPRDVVYVSCNVHTQARDVESILRKEPAYKVRSIRGADLFPQTNHVEGICVLQKVA